jgi:hypothetical protein
LRPWRAKLENEQLSELGLFIATMMSRHAVLLLLLVVFGLASAAATTPAPIPAAATWACVQQQRVHRLEHLLASLMHGSSSDLGAALHLLRASSTAADDLLACAAAAIVAEEVPAPHSLVTTAAAHTRQLHQLAASFTDIEETDGQLRRTTVSNIRVNPPDGSFQLVSNSYSSTPLITPEAADNLASVAPRLVATSNALLGGPGIQPAGPVRSPALVTAAAGPTRGQQPLQPLQPSLRIVGGVAAPTDRYCGARLTFEEWQ